MNNQEGQDTILYAVPPENNLTYRIACYAINPRVFRWILGRKVTLSGLPGDAEYVRSWHDPEADLFYVVFRSASFPECPVGVPPYREHLLIHEELIEVTP